MVTVVTEVCVAVVVVVIVAVTDEIEVVDVVASSQMAAVATCEVKVAESSSLPVAARKTRLSLVATAFNWASRANAASSWPPPSATASTRAPVAWSFFARDAIVDSLSPLSPSVRSTTVVCPPR